MEERDNKEREVNGRGQETFIAQRLRFHNYGDFSFRFHRGIKFDVYRKQACGFRCILEILVK